MPVCKSCGKEWSWKQAFIKSFTISTGMNCPHCKGRQYLTSKSRKRNSFSSFFILLILPLSILLNLSLVTTFFLLIVAGLLLLGIYPFFMELSNKEEPLW